MEQVNDLNHLFVKILLQLAVCPSVIFPISFIVIRLSQNRFVSEKHTKQKDLLHLSQTHFLGVLLDPSITNLI